MDISDIELAALQTAIGQYLEFLHSIGPGQPEALMQNAFLAEKYLFSAREKARAARVVLPDFSHNELVAIHQALLSTLEDTADELDDTPDADPRRETLLMLRSSCEKLLRLLRENFP